MAAEVAATIDIVQDLMDLVRMNSSRGVESARAGSQVNGVVPA